jgi:F0F1-type ATP synthase membrane subunit a
LQLKLFILGNYFFSNVLFVSLQWLQAAAAAAATSAAASATTTAAMAAATQWYIQDDGIKKQLLETTQEMVES